VAGFRAAQDIVELRSTGLVGRDHFAVEDGFVNVGSAATWSQSASDRPTVFVN
jgi:hypothetical protein